MSTWARKPDYRIKARTKDGRIDGVVGSAWVNESGNISIVLNPFVVLNSDTELQITMFPRDEKEGKQ